MMGRRAHVGYRGRALLILAALDGSLTCALILAALQGRASASVTFASNIFTPWVLVGLWSAVTLSCVWHAFRIRDALGWAMAIGIKVLWGTFATVGWLSGQVPYGYLGAAVWLAFAALVWNMSRWPERKPDQEQGPLRPPPGER